MTVLLEDKAYRGLTREESAWLKKFDKLFAQMPDSLKLVEVDDLLYVADAKAMSEESGALEMHREGMFLAYISDATLKITSMTC